MASLMLLSLQKLEKRIFKICKNISGHYSNLQGSRLLLGVAVNNLTCMLQLYCTGLYYILDIINVNLTVNFRAVLQSWFYKSSAS